MSYFKIAAKGVLWIGLLRGGIRGLSLLKTFILARLLAPNEFGLFAIAGLTMSLLEIFTETGINTILVQNAKKLNSYVSSAWVVSIFRGFLISAVMVMGAGLVSNFFVTPEARGLIILAALIPLFRGFINPAIARFQTELEFRKEFLFRIVIFFFEVTTVILVAYKTGSASSIVWGLIVAAILEVLFSFIFISPRPTLKPEIDKVKYILGRGKWITGIGILDYFIQNGDNIFVGKLLGASPLGIYQMSYQVSTLPVTEVSNILSKVTLPVFVRMDDENKNLTSAYKRLLVFIVAVTLPIAIIFILFADTLVQFLLGPEWSEVSTLIAPLAVFAFCKSLVLSSYAVLLARRRQEYVIVISLTGFIGMFASIIPLIQRFGIQGAAYAALIGAVVSCVPVVYFVKKVLKNNTNE